MDKITCPLAQAAEKFPKETALILGPRSVSYRQLDQCVSCTTKQLKKLGLRKGQRVAVVDTNSLEYIVILFSLWRMGVTAGLLSARLPEDALNNQLKKINAQILFTSQKQYSLSRKITLRKFRPDEVISFDMYGSGAGPKDRLEVEQPATIVFTSGSSGNPKAALLSFGNLYYNALGSNENIPVEKGDRWLLSLPLYHVAGLGILLRATLGGAAIVLPKEEEDLLAGIAHNKITHVSCVTTQLFRILQAHPAPKEIASLKAILLGGGPIPLNLLKEAIDYELPVYVTYGLTEMASQVATSTEPVNSATQRPAARVLHYRQVKIAADGEILVKGETLFKGYVDGERAKLSLDAEGWFATKDMGALDDEGNLTVTGRKDHLFISGGENVQPEEIEACLNQLPGIVESVVVPVANREFGFRPVAFLRTESSGELTTPQIRSHLEKSLPKFKIPAAFYEWPITAAEDDKPNRRTFTDLVGQPLALKPIA